MPLSDVEHQHRAQALVRQAIAHGRLPHAYLFHGPDGVGKRLFARNLAALLLCRQSPVGRPESGEPSPIEACGQCEECRLCAAETHPDVHVVHRRLNKFHPDSLVQKRKAIDLGVDVVRHFLIDATGKTPVRGRAKVFIVLEADRITIGAQNALLKTLEEPPGATYIILIVSSPDALLETTRSRCQLVPFAALPTEFVKAQLRRARPDVEASVAAWYARQSCGSVGAAIGGVDQNLKGLYDALEGQWSDLAARRQRPTHADWAERAKGMSEFYKTADPEISDTEAQRQAIKTMIRLSADVLASAARAAAGAASGDGAVGAGAAANRIAAVIPPPAAADMITRLVRTEAQLDMNANVQLCLDAMFNDLAALAAGERGAPVTLRSGS